VFGASQANGRSKRSVNCMETEDIALGKAWENVSLDKVITKDQTGKNY
jgi:hypothetical protein